MTDSAANTIYCRDTFGIFKTDTKRKKQSDRHSYGKRVRRSNGYKDRAGNWDQVRTNKAIAKRDRIDAKMEEIAPIVYGALTVSIRMGNREYYIPTR